MRRKETEKMETRSRTRVRIRQLLADLQEIAELEQENKRLRELLKAQLKSAEDDLVSTEQLQCSLKFVMEQSAH